MGVRFGLLGPLAVWEDDRELPLGSGRQRSLLALLLVHANEVVSLDRLVEELWAGSPPPTAQKGLHVYVSQLRKLLPADVLVTRSGGYLLRADETDAADGAGDPVRSATPSFPRRQILRRLPVLRRLDGPGGKLGLRRLPRWPDAIHAAREEDPGAFARSTRAPGLRPDAKRVRGAAAGASFERPPAAGPIGSRRRRHVLARDGLTAIEARLAAIEARLEAVEQLLRPPDAE